jgi:hypothetical protein
MGQTDSPCADPCSGEVVEGLEVPAGAFVADLQSPTVPEPSLRLFDNVAQRAQTAAMSRVRPTEDGDNPPATTARDVSRRAVGPIPEQRIGFPTRSTTRAGDRRKPAQHRQGWDRVMHVGRR